MSDTLAGRERDSDLFIDTSTLSKVYHNGHTIECRTVGGDEFRPLLDYDIIAQDQILQCKHRSHESVKDIFRHVLDDSYTKEKIKKGRIC